VRLSATTSSPNIKQESTAMPCLSDLNYLALLVPLSMTIENLTIRTEKEGQQKIAREKNYSWRSKKLGWSS
jgi:hypothetical protein